MKLYHVISLGTATLLSLGALVLLTKTNQVELNQDFRMETLKGNVAILNAINLESIIKIDQNEYAKIVLNGEHATITPTVYDAYHGLTDDQLENRELYRHTSHPTTFENDDYLMTMQFDYHFPYSSDVPTARLAIKNKHTNEVAVKNPIISEFTASEWVDREYLSEANGTYYYVLTTSGRNNSSSRVLVYTIDPDTLDLSFKFEKSFTSAGLTECVDNLLYTVEYLTDLDQPQSQLIVTNLETMERTTQLLGQDIFPKASVKVDDTLYLIIDYKLYEYTPEEANPLTAMPTPSFTENLDPNDYYWISQKLVHENYIYMIFQCYNEMFNQQILTVFDTNSKQFVYEGKINVRDDQGLVTDYQLKLK